MKPDLNDIMKITIALHPRLAKRDLLAEMKRRIAAVVYDIVDRNAPTGDDALPYNGFLRIKHKQSFSVNPDEPFNQEEWL